MPRVTKRMPPVEGAGANSTATCRLPIGLTYQQLLFKLTDIPINDVLAIRVSGDGEDFQTFRPGSFLDQINQDEGRNAYDPLTGLLMLDFNRFPLTLRAGRERTSIGTNHPEDKRPLQTFMVEFDLGDIDLVANPNPRIEIKAIQSSPAPLEITKKIRRFTYAAPAIGDIEIADLPKGDLINKIYFDAPEITKVKIERDGFIVFERTREENELIRADRGQGGGTFAGFVYDTAEEGYGSETLVTALVKDLRITLTVNAVNNQIPVHVEYIGGLQF